MISEILKNIPDTWELIELEKISLVNPKLDKSKFEDELLVSFVPMPAVEAENGSINVSEEKAFHQVKKGYTPFLENDVLFAKITPCMENGKVAIAPKLIGNLGFGSTEFHVLRTHTGFNEKFLYYVISSKLFRVEAEHNMTGAVGQRRVSTHWLSKFKIPVPPSNEQDRITAKIEELFSELDKSIESFETAKSKLEVYRQALLKHAFEGKLTEKWRKENVDKLETPEQLLTRINQEREVRYQQKFDDWDAKVEQWNAEGKEGKKPTKPKKLKIIPTDESYIKRVSELPIGWGYHPLGLLIDEPKYGTSKKCTYNKEGKGVLRIPNIAHNIIDSTDLKYATFEKHEIKDYKLYEGDIVIIRSNGSISLVGKAALINPQDIELLYAGYLIRLRPNTVNIYPKYLLYILQSHTLRQQIEGKAKSTSGVNNINAGEIQSLVISLPNIAEQQEIVSLLESNLSLCDNSIRDIEQNIKRSELLRQSILKKAFTGQLVSQDPKDEPTSKLLKKITIEKKELEIKDKAEKIAAKKA